MKDTALGFTAILMWSFLALLTTLAGPTPPLQLTAMAFTVGLVVGAAILAIRRVPLRTLFALPARQWAIGVYGLFCYHLFYFLAFRHAPVVEANLINYLWPLLTVLLGSLLPGERLRWYQGVGAVVGFLGAGLLVTGGRGLRPDAAYVPGYLLALGAAFTWSSFSVLLRRHGTAPTHAVAGFCGATALLAWGAHFILEETVWPSGWQWFAVVLMGLGPVGLAFYAWDHGVRRGSLKALGALAYLAPLFSTLLLIATGRAEPTWVLGLSCLLIVGGAVLAAAPTLREERR
jgi:drug/metabolite transporter (DMT)-like permease